MSEWAITREVIAAIDTHPNADRLEIARLSGIDYQFCVQKDRFKPGDKVFYFPIDTVMPHDLIERLGLVLTGKDKNRVKTIRLRGVISQGVVASEDELYDLIPLTLYIGDDTDFAEAFGCTKYEPPEEVQHGDLYPLPGHVRIYDLENAEKHPEIVARLMDESVLITEKIEGSHIACSLVDDDLIVCQRRYAIKPDQDHTWLKVAERQNVRDHLKLLQKFFGRNTITARGELVGPGIQGNIYGFDKHHIFFYDLEVGGVPPDEALVVFHKMRNIGMKMVPELWCFSLSGWLNGRSLREASDGMTRLDCPKEGEVLREGVVIRPAIEMVSSELGRIVIKQRSPEYLVGSDT